MTVTGLDTVDWHQLGLTIVAFVCVIIILILVVPADVGVRHDKDDDPPPPIFPAF